MFNLPESTIVNRIIPKSTVFSRALRKLSYRSLYTDQVSELWWQNKLSEANFGLIHSGAFPELQIFESKLNYKSLDKRLLRELDRAIPYYILHVLTYNGECQMFVADKSYKNGRICVNNYIRSRWMNKNSLSMDFNEKHIDKLYSSLSSQIRSSSFIKPAELCTENSSSDFMRYFQTMAMQRSYKPVLIIATLQSGGQITVGQAARFFVNFYRERKEKGLPIENGNCVYSDADASDKEIENNLIRNPINALCGSGFFEYDPQSRVFSLSPQIYDGLSLDQIDDIIRICQIRLFDYFNRR